MITVLNPELRDVGVPPFHSGREIFVSMLSKEETIYNGDDFAKKYHLELDAENTCNAIQEVVIGQGRIKFTYSGNASIEIIHSQLLSHNLLIDSRKNIGIVGNRCISEYLELNEKNDVILVNETQDLFTKQIDTRKMPLDHSLYQFFTTLLNAKKDEDYGFRLYQPMEPVLPFAYRNLNGVLE